jgi:hypothetical protein
MPYVGNGLLFSSLFSDPWAVHLGAAACTASALEHPPATTAGPCFVNGSQMSPKQIDIVRRAYQLWQENGQPEGKDQEFYFQAERELKEAEKHGDRKNDSSHEKPR